MSAVRMAQHHRIRHDAQTLQGSCQHEVKTLAAAAIDEHRCALAIGETGRARAIFEIVNQQHRLFFAAKHHVAAGNRGKPACREHAGMGHPAIEVVDATGQRRGHGKDGGRYQRDGEQNKDHWHQHHARDHRNRRDHAEVKGGEWGRAHPGGERNRERAGGFLAQA